MKYFEWYKRYIKPTLIICGYTAWLLDIVRKECGKKKIRGKNHRLRVYDVKGLDDLEVRLIDFWHPSAWTAKLGNDVMGLEEAFKHDVDIALNQSSLPIMEDNNIHKL